MKHKVQLSEYLEAINKVDPEFDTNELKLKIALYQSNPSGSGSSVIEKQWYDSLEKGTPDFSIYDGLDYLAESWDCYANYSSRYIDFITKKMPDKVANKLSQKGIIIADLGCGSGMSVLQLAKTFPGAKIYGTQLENTQQFHFASELVKQVENAKIGNLDKVTGADIVFASEYFEHFERPVDHLLEVLEYTKCPEIIVMANSFSVRAPGHFPEYTIGDEKVKNKNTARKFNKVLVDHGYKVMAVGWNRTPLVLCR